MIDAPADENEKKEDSRVDDSPYAAPFATAANNLPGPTMLPSVWLQSENDRFRAALQRIVDWSDCLCEHDDADCCANVADNHFHCPGCIAAQALQAPR